MNSGGTGQPQRRSQRCRSGISASHAGSNWEVDRTPSTSSGPPAGAAAASASAGIVTQMTPKRILEGLLTTEALIEGGCDILAQRPPPHHMANPLGRYQCLFRSIVAQHLRYTAPVFFMPGPVRLGRDIGLHLFEPRYRLLVNEVMQSFPVQARRGDVIEPREGMDVDQGMARKYRSPTFIYAHQAPLAPTTPATIVEIRRCGVNVGGSADVILRTVSYVWIEKVFDRPGTGGLVEARCVRMGKAASDGYERWCSMRYES